MKIPSDITYIKRVSSQVEDLLKANNADESDMFDIRLCLEEAIKNSIIHGNKGDKTLTVLINYTLDSDKFTIEIEDQGQGFNIAGVPDPTTEDNLLKEGGRGVFIIRKIMDKAEYNSSGNKICMVKFLKNRRR